MASLNGTEVEKAAGLANQFTQAAGGGHAVTGRRRSSRAWPASRRVTTRPAAPIAAPSWSATAPATAA